MDFGCAFSYHCAYRQRDSESRLHWFKRSLLELVHLLPAAATSLAFPHLLGCEEDPDRWPQYLAVIRQFATANPQLSISILQRSCEVARGLRTTVKSTHSLLKEASNKARKLARESSDPLFVRVAEAFISQFEENLMASLHTPNSTGQRGCGKKRI